MTEPMELYEHYDAVHAKEKAILNEHRHELIDIISMNKQLYKWTNVAYSAEKFLRLRPEEEHKPLKYSIVKPRPSAVFMSNAWRDLTDTEFLYDESGRYDEQLVAIKQFLGDVIMPMSGIEMNEVPVKTKLSAMFAKNACAKAELYFADTYEQIMGKRHTGQAIVRVYHNPDGKPLVIQKCQEEATGLTLEPFNAAGVIVPTGTIVGVGAALDLTLKMSKVVCKGTHSFDLVTYEVYEEDLALAPARLSPWAYSNPLDVGMYAISSEEGHKEKEFNPARLSMVSNLSLDLFRDAARKAMSICDFEPERVGYI